MGCVHRNRSIGMAHTQTHRSTSESVKARCVRLELERFGKESGGLRSNETAIAARGRRRAVEEEYREGERE